MKTVPGTDVVSLVASLHDATLASQLARASEVATEIAQRHRCVSDPAIPHPLDAAMHATAQLALAAIAAIAANALRDQDLRLPVSGEAATAARLVLDRLYEASFAHGAHDERTLSLPRATTAVHAASSALLHLWTAQHP